MPGPNTGSNRYGPASYVVGTPANGLGNGVNFTSIQAAYNQAVADGYGIANPTTILIRPGVYTENVSITDGGIAFDCASNAISGGAAIINGSLTLTVTGPNAFSFSNLTFTSSAGSTLIINGAAVPFRGSFVNCTFECTDPGITCVDISVPSGTFGFANFRDCRIESDGRGIYCNSRTVVLLENSDCTSGGSYAVYLDSTGRLQAEYASITSNAAGGVLFSTAANQATVFSSFINSATSAFDTTAGGAVNIFKSIITTSDVSGYWIVGTANLAYGDIINSGSAIGIDPGLGVITIPDWKPYAESGLAPGTGVVRGTSCFDSTQFLVTDGFVQAGASIPLTFNADVGSAVPVGNALSVLTGSHLTTTGAGNTITITLNGSVPTDWQMDGATTAQSVGGLMNLVGGAGIRTSGNGSNTITINGITYTDTAVNVTAQDDEGYFAIGGGAVTITTQAGAAQGASLGVVRVGATALVVDAQPGQFIQIGNSISTSGGLATSSADGDALTLVFRSTGSIWFATSVIGNWTLT